MTYVHILILIAVLQVVDIATTVYILRTGIGREGNPVMRKLIEAFGSPAAALIVTKVPLVEVGEVGAPASIQCWVPTSLINKSRKNNS